LEKAFQAMALRAGYSGEAIELEGKGAFFRRRAPGIGEANPRPTGGRAPG